MFSKNTINGEKGRVNYSSALPYCGYGARSHLSTPTSPLPPLEEQMLHLSNMEGCGGKHIHIVSTLFKGKCRNGDEGLVLSSCF